jgi:C-terminal processing protease CtpA/Prc
MALKTLRALSWVSVVATLVLSIRPTLHFAPRSPQQVLAFLLTNTNCNSSLRIFMGCAKATETILFGSKKATSSDAHLPKVWLKGLPRNQFLAFKSARTQWEDSWKGQFTKVDWSEAKKAALALNNLEKAEEALNGYLKYAEGPHSFLNLPTENSRSTPAASPSLSTEPRGMARIVIPNFTSPNVCLKFKQLLNSTQLRQSNGFILDLRNNLGGSVHEAICVLGTLVGADKTGVLLKSFSNGQLTAGPFDEHIETSEKQLTTTSVTVWVNSATASAAEILAGALQDYHRATLIGDNTFGKGVAQHCSIWQKDPDFELCKTEFLVFLPSGRTIHNVGLSPDKIEKPLSRNIMLREKDLFGNAAAFL